MKKAHWVIPIILTFLYIVIAIIRQAVLARNSSFRPSGYKINALGWSEVSITVFFDFENNTDLDINLKNIKLDVYIFDTYVTTVRNDNIKVRAHSTITTSVPVRFNPAQAAYGILPYLTHIKDLPLQFKGHLNIVTNYFWWNRMMIDETVTMGELFES